MNREEKKIHWEEIVKGWIKSKLTQQKYCAKEGINYTTFKSWRSKFSIKKRKKKKKRKESKSKTLINSNTFIPIKLRSSSIEVNKFSNESGINIVLGSKIELKIARGFDQETLLKIMQIL